MSALVHLPGQSASHLLPREASARPNPARRELPGGKPVPSEPVPRRSPGGAPAPPVHSDPAATVTPGEPQGDGGAEHGRRICRLAEASAKAGQGVEDAFMVLVKEIFDKRVITTEPKKPDIRLGGDTEEIKGKKGCCA